MKTLAQNAWPSADDACFENAFKIHNRCTPETRVSTLRRLMEWAFDSSPTSQPIFWLSGPAGSGKSTVAYSMCEQLKHFDPPVLGASFFCSRQYPARRNRLHVIPTIVKQLALVSPAFARSLEGRTVNIYSVGEHARHILADPWSSLSTSPNANGASRVVVIDALDELEDDDGSEFLRDLFLAINNSGSAIRGIKFLVTSREDEGIITVCQEILTPRTVLRLQSLDQEEVESDIHRYLLEALHGIRDSHAEQLKLLARESRGLFVFASTAVRFIMPRKLSTGEQGKQLDAFLKSWPRGSQRLPLDTLYTNILESAFDDLWDERKCARQKILSIILDPPFPLPADVIATISENDLSTVLADT